MLAPHEPCGARAIASALREADAAVARAIEALSRTDVQAETGLLPEQFLSLEAGWTGTDSRMIVRAERALRAMPLTKAAFLMGKISWGQVRAIVCSVRSVDVQGREQIDLLVGNDRADEPEDLLQRVEDAVSELRADLALAREAREIERSFLSIQHRLDGSSTLFGEADAEATATICHALDAVADRPVDADAEDAPSRARQRMEALVRICEMTLNGGHLGRPRPRLLATLDLNAVGASGRADGARVFASISGRPTRVTPVAAETMLCDATIEPVIFDGVRPVAVGDATSAITPKMRAALIARDGGCRFPGCNAPEDWCDAHHIRSRSEGGPTAVENLLLLCRRCHRTAHRFRWRIVMSDDGTIEFKRQGRSYSSGPRARPQR